jgi:hypothetical protein
VLDAVEFLDVPDTDISFNVQTGNLSGILDSNHPDQRRRMSTHLMDKMVNIRVPDEKVVFEACRKQ